MPKSTMSRRDLVEFILEQAQHQPVARRSRIYRALADEIGSGPEAAALRRLATELDCADRNCREFAFNLTIQPRGES